MLRKKKAKSHAQLTSLLVYLTLSNFDEYLSNSHTFNNDLWDVDQIVAEL
jgi:hypothetical protein